MKKLRDLLLGDAPHTHKKNTKESFSDQKSVNMEIQIHMSKKRAPINLIM